jgi:mono/diheme cytochrome c family protein
VSVAESGAVKAWILAFILMAGVGIGGLIGIGCLVGANTCPGKSPPKQTSTDGRVLYLANSCAICHGRDGKGSRGPSLVSGPLGALSEDELVGKIGKGKPLAGMPRFRTTLTQKQIRAVADYIVSLRGGS